MKTVKFPLLIMLSVMGMFIFNSCNKEELNNVDQNLSTSKLMKTVSNACVPKVEKLMAGQIMEVGTVTVWNDATKLYVKYDITVPDITILQTHLFVGDCDLLNDNPAPGQFPYKTDHNPGVTTFTYEIPLGGLPDCFCIISHAALSNEETAYAGTDEVQGSNWAKKFCYCVCTPPDKCYEYKAETSMSAGCKFNTGKGGNWFTYTDYANVEKTVTLFAGKTLVAGTVTFSAVSNGNVTITIVLGEDWSLQAVNEPVKIQGYSQEMLNLVLGTNVQPGKFTTYKGNELTITVPYSPYYAVHVSVQLRTEVPCPE